MRYGEHKSVLRDAPRRNNDDDRLVLWHHVVGPRDPVVISCIGDIDNWCVYGVGIDSL